MGIFNTVRFSLWGLQQKRIPFLPPERVQAIQERRLRKLLRYAAKQSPFYREKYRGIDLDRCALTELPTTTKTEIMDHFDEAVTDPQVKRADVEAFMSDLGNVPRKFLDRYVVSHTSGSQGQPLLILQDRLPLELLFVFQLTRGNVKRVGAWDAVRRLWNPGRLAVIALKRGFYPSAAAWEHMPEPAKLYLKLLRLTPTDPDLIDRLNEFRPNAITAYVSMFEFLAMHKERLHLVPELQQIVSNSETLTPRHRQMFQDAFGVPVLDHYSMGECSFLTNGCKCGPGAHVNADWAILENADEQNRPVPPGQLGHKALLTNLANRVMPFIRYEIGDRLIMSAEPCGCGNRLPLIASIEGRSADFFWVRANGEFRQLGALVFKNALQFFTDIREWQVVQTERNRVLVRIEPIAGKRPDEGRVREKIDEQLGMMGLGGYVQTDMEWVPALTPDPTTRKIRRAISRVGPPEELSGVNGGDRRLVVHFTNDGQV
jgi:phenylacetate-CoA ligase